MRRHAMVPLRIKQKLTRRRGQNMLTRFGKIAPPTSGKYRLGLTADDGARVYLDGKLNDLLA